jgi:hypothetical protein
MLKRPSTTSTAMRWNYPKLKHPMSLLLLIPNEFVFKPPVTHHHHRRADESGHVSMKNRMKKITMMRMTRMNTLFFTQPLSLSQLFHRR